MSIIRHLPGYIGPSPAATHCTKHTYSGRDITCNILVAICIRCTSVLGFSAMNGGEGPRMLHELLYTQFQVVPETIVYDKICNTVLYCLVQEPKFYANMRFVVDPMHKGFIRIDLLSLMLTIILPLHKLMHNWWSSCGVCTTSRVHPSCG